MTQKSLLAAALSAACLAVAVPVSAQSPDGAGIFRANCATCHDGSAASRAPGPEQLKDRTPESIIAALTGGAMRYQGLSLSGAERRAVAEFLTGKTVGADVKVDPNIGRCVNPPAFTSLGNGPNWNGWSADLANTHAVSAKVGGLTAAQLPKLTLKWALGLPEATSAWAQPTVVNGRVFVGSQNGTVFSLDAKSGCVVWTYVAKGGVRGSVVVGPRPGASGTLNAYFIDQKGYGYAVDASTGAEVWVSQVDAHPLVRLTGSPALYGNRLFVPTSSYEEVGKSATYNCCTFRGAVVAIDVANGKTVWRAYPIPEEPRLMGKRPDGGESWGPSGGAIWSAPTIDPKRSLIYVGVGNTYSGSGSQPGTDAIVAFDLKTGATKWTRQLELADVYGCRNGEPNCGTKQGPDYDFGASPALAALPGGKEILVVGQKSGMAFGLEPDTGKVVWEYRAGQGGSLGGIEWGVATDATYAYLPVADQNRQNPGGLHAVKLATGERVWFTPHPEPLLCGQKSRLCNPAQSAAVTAIPGAVLSGSFDGGLRAYSTQDGSILWQYDTNREYLTVNGVRARGASLNGPAPVVIGGMMFVNSGDYRARPGNVLLAFGID
ncbi:MAG: PQQ-binding-like beta-propeller repeat protein [Vicinamibacterales bacterium]